MKFSSTSHKIMSRPKNKDVILNKTKQKNNPKVCSTHRARLYFSEEHDYQMGPQVSYKCYSQGSGGGGRGGGGSSVAAAAAAFACAASFVIDLVILPLRRP